MSVAAAETSIRDVVKEFATCYSDKNKNAFEEIRVLQAELHAERAQMAMAAEAAQQAARAAAIEAQHAAAALSEVQRAEAIAKKEGALYEQELRATKAMLATAISELQARVSLHYLILFLPTWTCMFATTTVDLNCARSPCAGVRARD